jgi:hypothetical protein
MKNLVLRFHSIYWWLISIVLIGLLFRIGAAMTSAPLLITKSIPDDGFYYFQIARNLAQGAGITADGITPTNGFHPLWLFVIAPLWRFFDSTTAINAALVVGSFFDMFAALMLYRVVNSLTARPEAGALAMAAYFLNPFVVMLSLNGLETALNVGMVALVAERFLALYKQPQPTLHHFVPSGLALGTAILARTDNIFLLAACGLVILAWRALPLTSRLSGLALIGGLVALVTAPWFVWNYLTFGSFMQVSGTALPYIERQIFLRENPAAQSTIATWDYFLHNVLLFSLIDKVGIFSGLGRWANWDAEALPGALMLGLLVVGPFMVLETRRLLLCQLGQISFLLFYVALLLGYHIAARWLVREWYIMPVAWVIVLLLALCYSALLSLLAERVPWRRLHRVVLVICCVVLLAHTQKFWQQGMYPWQAGFFTILEEANRLPAGSRIGLSDSGFVSYFSDKQVVNLDGIVNNPAAEAIQEGRLMDYLLDTCVDYIYVQERYLQDYFYGPGFINRLENQGLYSKVKRNTDEVSACYRLPSNGVIDLSRWDGQYYTAGGWSLAERNGKGIWAVAKQADLQFSVEQSRAYIIRFWALPFSYDGAPNQQVLVTMNGATVGVVDMASGKQFNEYAVSVPIGLVQPGLNTLSLSFAYASTPTEVGYGRDDRTLAARFASFQFIPID